ncbi:MAG: hypothetical protein RQ922_00680 [Thermoproteota archaeon]|nr:hypothetical protein [Thermoproteota archaeon]
MKLPLLLSLTGIFLLLILNLPYFYSEENTKLILVYNFEANTNIYIQKLNIPLTIDFKGNNILEFLKYNQTCYNVTSYIKGKITLKLLPLPQTQTIDSKNHTIVCFPLSKYINQQLFSQSNIASFNQTLKYNYNIKNFTYNAPVMYNDYQAIEYNIEGYFDITVTSGKNYTKSFSFFSSKMFNSFYYNIPLYSETYIKGNFETSYSLPLTGINLPLPIANSFSYEIKYKFELVKEEGFNLKRKMNLNKLEFKTTTNITFVVFSNSKINSIKIRGSQFNLTTDSPGMVYVIYGSKGLIISIDKIKVKSGRNEILFIPLYFINYASISYYNEQNFSSITLGANVGSYDYEINLIITDKSITAYALIGILAVMLIVLALAIFKKLLIS